MDQAGYDVGVLQIANLTIQGRARRGWKTILQVIFRTKHISRDGRSEVTAKLLLVSTSKVD